MDGETVASERVKLVGVTNEQKVSMSIMMIISNKL